MIIVTGATGQLGRLAVEGLLKKVNAKDIVVAVRDPEKAKDFAARGVSVRLADYSRPETLDAAFAGGDKLLFISSSELGKRPAQHQAVIDAAKRASIKLIAYTSVLGASTSGMLLAKDHQFTEEAIRASGLPFVFLRNSFYNEVYTATLDKVLAHGAVLGSAGEGRVAGASRADYAEAAVAVLTTPGHENHIYELAGDNPFSMGDFAAEVARQSGKNIRFQNLPPAEYAAVLESAGLPPPVAAIFADVDVVVGKGVLPDRTGDLHRLIGHATTPLSVSIAAALRAST